MAIIGHTPSLPDRPVRPVRPDRDPPQEDPVSTLLEAPRSTETGLALADLDQAWDCLIDSEGHSTEAGQRAGRHQATRQARAEGLALGFRKGIEIGARVGFFQGFAQVWLDALSATSNGRDSLSARQIKARKILGRLEALARSFSSENMADQDVVNDLHAMESKFKACCSLLKVPTTTLSPSVVSW
ncbi:uncharacterized protein LOC131888403 [Tigriopus californicus]|uniref:uncharacterized protein LOC131888403 n=1 Tax=Tigriopus californicus TaxID=6832 RepID=UPI0027DA1386|nr:uncharacterized protein LOC131888403 [Tigriopus californicus]